MEYLLSKKKKGLVSKKWQKAIGIVSNQTIRYRPSLLHIAVADVAYLFIFQIISILLFYAHSLHFKCPNTMSFTLLQDKKNN